MQRRLALAFVLTALVSVVLVGVGILAIAQIGARNRAEDEVERGLNVVVALIESQDRPAGQLQDLIPARRGDLQLAALEPLLVGDGGDLMTLTRRGRVGEAVRGVASVSLTPAQVADLDDGQTVVLDVGRTVIGLRAIEGIDRDGPPRTRLALLAAQDVTAIASQAVVWFLMSSVVVLLGAALAGSLLARRVVRPIRDIQAATAAIAAGQLDTRVAVESDDELSELAESVNHMAADLERSKALDQQFLLSVSHDLRTPLTAIAGYAEALRDGAAPDPAMAGEIIGNHADRLERLVGDLLDLAKLDANRFTLDLRPVDLSVVAARTAAGLAPRARDHGIEIELPSERGPSVLADADRLAQAIGNLIDNAMGFADRRVRLEVTATPSPAPMAALAVIDDGPGFAPDDLPFVFDRLYTGRASPRRSENPTGVGLAIVRELAAAMGGSVEAGNDPNGGARMVLRLPLHQPTASPGPAEASSGEGQMAGAGPVSPPGGEPPPPGPRPPGSPPAPSAPPRPPPSA